MIKKLRSLLIGALVLVLAAVCVIWLITGGPEHIEDTNGADNFALQQISDSDIIDMSYGDIGLGKTTDSFTNTVSYSSKKYTGVSEIWGENIITNRLEITVNHAQVTAGNFRIVLVVDDEIVHDFTLNELTQTYVAENVSGYASLRIAGESASFKFDYSII